jgi:hypothetical protein
MFSARYKLDLTIIFEIVRQEFLTQRKFPDVHIRVSPVPFPVIFKTKIIQLNPVGL